MATQEEYSDYYVTNQETIGYCVKIFSTNYRPILEKYNQLVLKQDNLNYVANGEDFTVVIYGNLKQDQAEKLGTYYANK